MSGFSDEGTQSNHDAALVVRFAKTKADKQKIKSCFGLIRFSGTDDRRHLLVVDINLKRLITAFALFTVVGYATAVCGFYAWRATIPHNQIEFIDILLPNWSTLSDKEGKTRIAQGMAAFRAEDWPLALFKLRAGLMRHPHDAQARYALAQIYCKYDMGEDAMRVLIQGLDWGYPGKESIALFVQLAEVQNNTDFIARHAERILTFPEIQQEVELQQSLQNMVLGND